MTFKSNYFILEERTLCIPASLLWEIEPGIFFFPEEIFLLSESVIVANRAVIYCVIDINYIKKQLSKGILISHCYKQTYYLVRTGL